MVAHMTPFRTLPGMVLACWLLAAHSGMAAAETLRDPTRPPAEIMTSAGSEVQSTAVSENKGLQIVVVAPDRRTAIINGHSVEVGGKYGDATLVEITDDAVVLRDARGRKTSLSMFPGVGVRKKTLPSLPQTDKTDAGKTEKPATEQAAPPAAAPQEEK